MNANRPSPDGSHRRVSPLASLVLRAAPFLWASLLVLVPISSFPPLAEIAGGTGSVVAPLAAVPALLLLGLWVFPKWLKGDRLPPSSGPLFAFVGIAVLASAGSVFLDLHPFLGQAVFGRSVRALATLAVGLTFYFTSATYPTTEGKLRSSMRWLAVGAVVMLLWSTVQAALSTGDAQIPWQLRDFHRLFSVRDLISGRVTGFAYEPSWLADQLVVLYLPLWLGAVLAGFSAFRKIRGRFPVEALLLGWGLLILILSKSRIGILSALAVAAILGVVAIWRLGRHLRLPHGRGRIAGLGRGRTFSLGVRLVLLVVLVGLLVGGVYLLGMVDPRLGRLFTVRPVLAAGGWGAVYYYANQLAYAERVMYWATGLKTFGLHPLLGVGLGNSGFLFRQSLPVYGYFLPEMIAILNGAPGFPNPKNLWVRLLAETGVVGFLLFTIWLARIGLAAHRLSRGQASVLRVIGAAGLIALATQVIEGFSLDSFALPQLWIMLGLVTAGASISSVSSPRADGKSDSVPFRST